MRIKVAIIGFGMSARVFHTPLISACDEFEITKVYSSKKYQVLDFLPGTEVVTNLNDIFSDDLIDLIILCGPNKTHYEQTKLALQANKHVVVEKPFVANSREGSELIQLAKKQNKILTVFHNRRWDCDFLAVKKLITDNTLGEIKLFESFYDRWRPMKREGKWREEPGVATGILYDLGSHQIDQILQLFGKPDSVLADIVAQKENQGIDDYYHLIFKYGVNRVIIRGNSFTRAPNRFSILGSKKNYFKTGLDPQADRLDQRIDPRSKNFGKEDPAQSGVLIDEDKTTIVSPAGTYIRFYELLASAITDGTMPPVEPNDALEVIKLIEIAIKSSTTGKEVAL